MGRNGATENTDKAKINTKPQKKEEDAVNKNQNCKHKTVNEKITNNVIGNDATKNDDQEPKTTNEHRSCDYVYPLKILEEKVINILEMLHSQQNTIDLMLEADQANPSKHANNKIDEKIHTNYKILEKTTSEISVRVDAIAADETKLCESFTIQQDVLNTLVSNSSDQKIEIIALNDILVDKVNKINLLSEKIDALSNQLSELNQSKQLCLSNSSDQKLELIALKDMLEDKDDKINTLSDKIDTLSNQLSELNHSKCHCLSSETERIDINFMNDSINISELYQGQSEHQCPLKETESFNVSSLNNSIDTSTQTIHDLNDETISHTVEIYDNSVCYDFETLRTNTDWLVNTINRSDNTIPDEYFNYPPLSVSSHLHSPVTWEPDEKLRLVIQNDHNYCTLNVQSNCFLSQHTDKYLYGEHHDNPVIPNIQNREEKLTDDKFDIGANIDAKTTETYSKVSSGSVPITIKGPVPEKYTYTLNPNETDTDGSQNKDNDVSNIVHVKSKDGNKKSNLNIDNAHRDKNSLDMPTKNYKEKSLSTKYTTNRQKVAIKHSTNMNKVNQKLKSDSEKPNHNVDNVYISLEDKNTCNILAKNNDDNHTYEQSSKKNRYRIKNCLLIHDSAHGGFDNDKFPGEFNVHTYNAKSISSLQRDNKLKSVLYKVKPECIYIHLGLHDILNKKDSADIIGYFGDLFSYLLDNTRANICYSYIIPVVNHTNLSHKIRDINVAIIKTINQMRRDYENAEKRLFSYNNESLVWQNKKSADNNIYLTNAGKLLAWDALKKGITKTLRLQRKSQNNRNSSSDV